MTHTDAATPRKYSRAGLYWPYGIVAALAIAWSLAWVWLSHEAASRIDQAAADLRAKGWQVSWATRHIGGYPFRLDVDFTGLSLAEPSGWGLATPQLKSEAFLFMPTHWIFVVPAGLTVTRPRDGGLSVGATALRASINGWDQTPSRISVEGDGMTFTPAPGAKPFFVTAAQNLQFYTRAGPDDQGAVFLSLDQASAPLTGLMGRIAEGKPVDLKLDGIYSQASRLTGGDWPAMVRTWAGAGGTFKLRQMTLHAGEAVIDSRTGEFAADNDGRLTGTLTASLNKAPQTLGALGAPAAPPPSPEMQVTLGFRNGQTMLGETPLFPAPRVF